MVTLRAILGRTIGEGILHGLTGFDVGSGHPLFAVAFRRVFDAEISAAVDFFDCWGGHIILTLCYQIFVGFGRQLARDEKRGRTFSKSVLQGYFVGIGRNTRTLRVIFLQPIDQRF